MEREGIVINWVAGRPAKNWTRYKMVHAIFSAHDERKEKKEKDRR